MPLLSSVAAPLVHNWSRNHARRPWASFHPKSVAEVEELVARHHALGTGLRVSGAHISPNGLGLCGGEAALMCMDGLNAVVGVDAAARTVTAQAGVTVQELLDALAPHGLTLGNLASINQQQLGGFFQVGAHGTGVRIPTVEEFVDELVIVTPGRGTLRLRRGDALFEACNLGLGLLGAVVEFTVRCVPTHWLEESTMVMTRAEVRRRHAELITTNRHCKYMWIPYADKVVVVTANPVPAPTSAETTAATEAHRARCRAALAPMLALLDGDDKDGGKHNLDNFADLRAVLLSPTATKNLDLDHVKRVNQAEAQYHEAMTGVSTRPSERVLAFDCGGQQLVMEVAMNAGGATPTMTPNHEDVDLVLALLEAVEREGIPAPAPIEHRWTGSSSSLLSPTPKEGVWGWVGVVMYLTVDRDEDKDQVKDAFQQYRGLVHRVAQSRGVVLREHWAKLEAPRAGEPLALIDARERLSGLYDWDAFWRVQQELDPKGILLNDWAKQVLPPPSTRQGAKAAASAGGGVAPPQDSISRL